MRHAKKRHKLGRTRAHRKALLASLASALVLHKRIRTTLAKAKATQVFVEPLITRARKDTPHNRRTVFGRLRDKHATTELFTGVAEAVGERPGGYTRVMRMGPRSGDGAEMALLELVDFNDSEVETYRAYRRTRRGRRRRPQAAPEE